MKTIVFCLAICVSGSCFSQVRYGHSFSGEFGGIGVGISAQYDYIFRQTDKGFFDARAGLGAWYFPSNSEPSKIFELGISVPHAITYNFGSRNHFLEAGIGASFTNKTSHHSYGDTSTSNSYYYGPMIGYRSISKNGFQFRVYVNYLVYSTSGGGAFPYAGIGFGKAFRKK